MRAHARRTRDVFINSQNDSLASFGNPNSIRFSPGNGGGHTVIGVTMNIPSWQKCHTTLLWEP